MPSIYLLDAGPLGLLAHDRVVYRRAIEAWMMQEVEAGAKVYLSEVADFEVRRELTRLIRSGQVPPSRLNRLDLLSTIFTYLPVTTAVWRRAADYWAEARAQGMPTSSPDALDADALIAGQAAEIGATVVTCNPTHLGRWAPIQNWPRD